MERLLDASLRAGAHGLSSGLVYPPGCFASTEELLGLCDRVLVMHDGIIRSELSGDSLTHSNLVAASLGVSNGRSPNGSQNSSQNASTLNGLSQ